MCIRGERDEIISRAIVASSRWIRLQVQRPFALSMTSSRRQHTPVRNLARRTMSLQGTLGNTTCSKGHLHPPWNTTGVLSIAKCESVCGFCQKETKTAANLRKVCFMVGNFPISCDVADRNSMLQYTSRMKGSISRLQRDLVDEDDCTSTHLSHEILKKTHTGTEKCPQHHSNHSNAIILSHLLGCPPPTTTK